MITSKATENWRQLLLTHRLAGGFNFAAYLSCLEFKITSCQLPIIINSNKSHPHRICMRWRLNILQFGATIDATKKERHAVWKMQTKLINIYEVNVNGDGQSPTPSIFRNFSIVTFNTFTLDVYRSTSRSGSPRIFHELPDKTPFHNNSGLKIIGTAKKKKKCCMWLHANFNITPGTIFH